jgi:hypothetical protein
METIRNANCRQTKERWEADVMKDLKLLKIENWHPKGIQMEKDC